MSYIDHTLYSFKTAKFFASPRKDYSVRPSTFRGVHADRGVSGFVETIDASEVKICQRWACSQMDSVPVFAPNHAEIVLSMKFRHGEGTVSGLLLFRYFAPSSVEIT